MNLDDALQRLFHRNIHLIKLDLEPMRALMDMLGNPDRSMICLHVAGTNGKGSVCAMLASVMRRQGYRTGLYTSPHLVVFNERIQVNGVMVSDHDLLGLIREVEMAAARLPGLGFRDVTFFEFTTALAFLHFQKSGVHAAVIETGMGGRLDATNIITPAVSIITSIGLDHTAYLGDTIEQIAVEKAGIIKACRPVIVGAVPEAAGEAITRRAAELRSPVVIAENSVNVTVKSMSLDGQSITISSDDTDYGVIHTRLFGQHQAVNAAVVVAASECLNGMVGVPVSVDAIKKGIAEAEWLARTQVLSIDPPVILDGGHNAEAAEALAAWIKKVGRKRPLGMLVGFLADKDPGTFMQAFSRLVKRIWIVPIQSDRAMPSKEVRSRIHIPVPTEVSKGLDQAKSEAIEWAKNEGGIILICGSLYLAGEVLSTR